MRLLIIDDERLFLVVLGRHLRDLGHVVISCSNGQDGLAAFETERPDAIILDVVMPGMDGVEFLRRLRLVDKTVPVIVMSAGPELLGSSTLDAMQRLGMCDSLEKPFDLHELDEALDRLNIRPLHVTDWRPSRGGVAKR